MTTATKESDTSPLIFQMRSVVQLLWSTILVFALISSFQIMCVWSDEIVK